MHRALLHGLTALLLLAFPLLVGSHSVLAQEDAEQQDVAPVSDVVEEDANDESAADVPQSVQEKIDVFFGTWLVKPLGTVLFYDFGTPQWLGTSVPLIVLWLLVGAIFFTLRMGFINFRAFWHAIRLTRGDYDDPDEPGEVSHFQALASALSATIGLGNIAGVAIAVGTGGPGAIFWMILAGTLGMSSKFVECTLAQIYRKVDADGTVSGGPMRYLKDGLAERSGLGGLGIVLSIVFVLFCMGGSFGGGCAFQVSQSLGVIKAQLVNVESLQPALERGLIDWLYGGVMVVFVGVVIIGGIRRIAATAEKIVPLMCCIYVLLASYILLTNLGSIGWAFGEIFSGAFTPEAGYGGLLGVLVIGIKRAAFSNEAGIGSAAIAHAAAKTEEPVREGIVASLGPFIDTVVICTMTGLVIVITGAYDKGDAVYGPLIEADNGAALTSLAFGSAVSWFPIVLTVAVVLFAYSTMISWSYYGERCWSYLFGTRTSLIYRIFFLVFVMAGAVVTAGNVLTFSDLMILSMAFPNMLGVALMSGVVRRRLDEYWVRYKAGEMEPVGRKNRLK